MKLMPPSRAAWTTRTQSSWSRFPQAPNIMAPRQYRLTWIPVVPRVVRSMYVEATHSCTAVIVDRGTITVAEREHRRSSRRSQNLEYAGAGPRDDLLRSRGRRTIRGARHRGTSGVL